MSRIIVGVCVGCLLIAGDGRTHGTYPGKARKLDVGSAREAITAYMKSPRFSN